MIDSRQLYARGIGFTDANLLASCLATAGASLWTLDKRLNSVAEELNVAANIRLFIKYLAKGNLVLLKTYGFAEWPLHYCEDQMTTIS